MLWTVYYLRPHLFGLIEVNHGHNSLRKKMTKPSGLSEERVYCQYR